MNKDRDIAVIAMNCRFPGADSLESFWDILTQGKAPLNETFSDIITEPGSIPINIHVPNVDKFDADFFSYTYREAEVLDPQQRIFLQLGWEILERAGYDPFQYKGLIGLFAGASMSTYLINYLINHSSSRSIGAFQTLIYNEKDYLTSLLAYHLNLKGPCVTIQSSCSTSLVAIHMACESLLSGQCEMALAGGITLTFPTETSYLYQEGGLVSKDGRICAFDSSASGTVYSNGAGIVLLKRLEEALNDGDTVLAIIKGTAINNDGASRNGFSSPGVDGQSLVIAEALSLADVSPDSISYIETHGSGTPLGDAVEFEAMKEVFSAITQKKRFCAIGSVKTNIGHTQVASGIAGFIKTCLSLNYQKLVPSLNFKESNSKCDFVSGPFYVNTTIKDWLKSEFPRRAGVNSFGLGGANAHVILEEFSQNYLDRNNFFPESCILSAKTDTALREICLRCSHWLEMHENLNLNDFAFTTKVGRRAFPHRLAITFLSRKGLIQELKQRGKNNISSKIHKPSGICVEFGEMPLFNLQELKSILMNYPAFNGLILELKPFLVCDLKEKETHLISYLVLLKILIKMNVQIDEFLVDKDRDSLGSSVGFNLSLEETIVLFHKSEDSRRKASGAITIVNIDSSIERTQWKEEKIKQNFVIIPFSLPTENCLPSLFLERFFNWINDIWLKGIDFDWSVFQMDDFKRVFFPTYPFELHQFFVGEGIKDARETITASSASILTVVKKIWEEVIGIEVKDENDNFFEMGGHSLLATRLLSSIGKQLNCRIPLQDFLENPTVGGLFHYIEKLCWQGKNYSIPLPELIPDLQHRYDPFPLTVIQQAYWVGRHSELELGNIATHMYLENDLLNLDLTKFEDALNESIKHHDMLRAIILNNGTQRILKSVGEYKIVCNDFCLYLPEAKEQKLLSIREEMSHEKIDTERWPLFRIVASKINDQTTRLHISIDLLILDAWSIELWLKDLGDIYRNGSQFQAPLAVSFRDYVLAVKKIEKTPLYEESRDYWTKRINNGFSPAPQLPLAKLPSLLKEPRFKRFQGKLDKKNWTSIKEIGKCYNITPPVILIGIFSEILRIWSKFNSFTLNLTLFNRLPIHSEVDHILGDFTSLTLLEINFIKDLPFFERLKAIQHQLWKDLEYRYFSGPQVTRELLKNPETSNQTFPIVFTSLLAQDEMALTPFDQVFTDQDTFSISQTPQVWLDHQVMEREDGIHFNWDVLDNLFPEKLIEVMFQTYTQLLGELSVTPKLWERNTFDMKFSLPQTASLLFGKESYHLSNRTEDIDLVNAFLKWAEKEPDRIGIITPSRSFTYGEMFNLSQQIVTSLVQNSIQSGELVGIIMHKSWEMVATMLGILQSGAAFLPIDASYPPNRIQEMLSVSQIKCILIDKDLMHSLSFDLDIIVLPVSFDLNYLPSPPNTCMSQYNSHLSPLKEVHSAYSFRCYETDSDSLQPDAFQLNVPIYKTTEEDLNSRAKENLKMDLLAYAFFTSGSTGNPKCVEITHNAVLNTLSAVKEKYRICEHDIVLALSSFSFDLSIFDIFGLLSAGGRIVIPSQDQMKDPHEWVSLIIKYGVTIWNTTPALMQMLYSYVSKTENERKLYSLRLVMLSGDKIPIYLGLELKNILKIPQVVSLGGATEASIWSIWYDIQGDEGDLNSIPYGTPMPGQEFFVLDELMQECPIWVEGDLFIKGAGLARCYRNNPVETQSRFVNHRKWGRIYKTGDRGLCKNTGVIEFLGRLDNEVKIRGHRIDLGEIEAKLSKHKQVKSVVVVDYQQEDQKELACYVELHSSINQSKEIPDGIIIDPIERLQFKVADHGLRKDLNHKTYQLNLSMDENMRAKFIKRKSCRSFSDSLSLELHQIEQLLSSLRSIEFPGLPFGKRLYGSGGGLYPVQVYMYIKKDKITDLSAGIYYYHPKLHQLLLAHESEEISLLAFPPNNRKVVSDASFLFFLIANLDAIVPMYGEEESQRLILLEAGIITQLMEMQASYFHIGLCQVGGTNFEAIREGFQLENDHQFIHCIAGGPVTEEKFTIQGMANDMELYHSNETEAETAPYSDLSSADLKNFLADCLPNYMIPQTFHIVPSIPLTANGKLDRRACYNLQKAKKPEKQRVKSQLIHFSPSNDTEIANVALENQLSVIWQRVLDDISFTATDNFFDVGGNSINLVHVYRALREELGVKISMIDLFKHPSIRGLSNFLNHTEKSQIATIEEETTRSQARQDGFRKRKETAGSQSPR